MKPFLMAAIALLLFPGEAPRAQKMYKWVDEEGVTHFSMNPPIDAGQPPDALEQADIPGSSRAADEARYSGIRHTWWSQSRPGTARYLRLSSDEFEIGRRSLRGGAIHEGKIASGIYEEKNGYLTLYYYYNREAPGKIDSSENFSVLQMDGARLSLLAPDAQRPTRYERLSRRRTDEVARRLDGHWRQKDSARNYFVFEPGTFSVLSSANASGAMAFGNWEWSDPYLSLDYVVDLSGFSSPVSVTWTILELAPDRMTVREKGSGKQLEFVRVR